jgi:putative heme-binding domain-containing protein
VACYRHTQFPEAYRGGFFAADWTFGRVWFLSLKAAGSSFRARPEPFIEAVGESGFAPVALCVQPTTGDLFVAIGGRGTRGGVYRVRHTDAAPGAGSTPVQPGTLEWKSDRAREVVEQAAGGGAGSLRAWELCRRHLDKLTDDQVGRLCLAGSTSSDPGVRRACLRFHADAETAGRKPVAAKTSDGQRLTLRLRAGTRPGTVANAAPELLGREPAARLECLAAFQAAVGGRDTSAKVTGTVWEGYTAGKPGAESDGIAQAFGRLWREFPSGDADVDRELTRTAAMIQSDRPEVFAGVLDRLSADSPPVDDVHHLIVLARLAAPRDEKARGRIAAALLALDRKYVRSGVQRDRHWPLRVGEAYAELCRRDPALAAAVVGHADFGRPEHTLFAGPERKRAAERFAAKAADANFEWTPGVAELIATLPPATSLPLLRKQWDNQAVRDAVLTALARNPAEEDRDRFVAGLGSTTPAVVTACLGALEKLPPAADARSLAAAVRAQRNLPDAKESATLRGRFDALLRRATGESHAGPAAWAEWFAAKYPKDAALVAGADGVDVAAWRKRLAALDWPAGDTERGRRVFQKAACASCHSGARAVGPDLAGVAGRFSRDDLFTAILQPSLEVPARYRATQVATTAGRTYLGLIVYEAVDGVILQTGPDAVVRVAGGDIESRQTVTRSLMPAGLLDMASDRDLADLYAYLRSLKGSGPPAAGGP